MEHPSQKLATLEYVQTPRSGSGFFWWYVAVFTIAHLLFAIIAIFVVTRMLHGLRLWPGLLVLTLQAAGAMLMPVVALAHKSGLQRMLPDIFWLPIWLANSFVWGLLLAYLRSLVVRHRAQG